MQQTAKFIFLGALIFFAGVVLGTYAIFFIALVSSENDLEVLDAYEYSVQSSFVAVDEQGKGVTADLTTEIRPGTGLVLVNINNILADLNTQYSARTAAAVASNFTQISLKNFDVIYNLQTEASIVGGQSAATIMAVSTIAALQNKSLKQQVIATGSVNQAGEVVSAGALVAKAQAARDSNFTLFIVPAGLGTNPTNFKREKSCTLEGDHEYCYVQYVGEQISIGDDIGIEVQEVKTVAEAWRYFEV